MADTGNIDITILVDNKAGEGLMAEHGLALRIEAGSHRILFDTGQGPALPYNSAKLGVRLEEADMLVLSHGHYDHTGGIPCVVNGNSDIQVYCHPGIVVPRYSIRPAAQPRAINMPRDVKSVLDNMSSKRLHFVTEPTLIAPDIGLTGSIPRKNDFEDTGGPFFLDIGGHQADPIDDDQAMWIKTERGLVIIVGCCHSGLVNTIHHIRKITGESKIVSVVGGFHLGEASARRLEKTCELLRESNVESLVLCHCTGETAMELFRNVLGNTVDPGHAGLGIRI